MNSVIPNFILINEQIPSLQTRFSRLGWRDAPEFFTQKSNGLDRVGGETVCIGE